MKSKGFTIVELLIVITLMCIFVMATTQLTGKWVEQTRLTEAQGLIERAIGQTKALAIRNPKGVFDGAAAALCVNDKTIEIKSIVDGAVNCGTAGEQIWSAKLPKDVSINKFDTTTAVTCIALFNHRANYTPNADCANSPKLTLAIKGHNETNLNIN